MGTKGHWATTGLSDTGYQPPRLELACTVHDEERVWWVAGDAMPVCEKCAEDRAAAAADHDNTYVRLGRRAGWEAMPGPVDGPRLWRCMSCGSDSLSSEITAPRSPCRECYEPNYGEMVLLSRGVMEAIHDLSPGLGFLRQGIADARVAQRANMEPDGDELAPAERRIAEAMEHLRDIESLAGRWWRG